MRPAAESATYSFPSGPTATPYGWPIVGVSLPPTITFSTREKKDGRPRMADGSRLRTKRIRACSGDDSGGQTGAVGGGGARAPGFTRRCPASATVDNIAVASSMTAAT